MVEVETAKYSKELLKSMKEDTVKIGALKGESNYSIEMKVGENLLSNEVSFKDLNLDERLLEHLYSMKFEKPSNIQAQSIRILLDGKNGVFHSPSGSGKTMAFGISIVNMCKPGDGTQALVLSPTRELSIQIYNVLSELSAPLGLKVACALGNLVVDSINEEIVVGSPGKIIGLVKRKAIDSKKMKIIILDESDALITNQSFVVPTLNIIAEFPKAVKGLFSATYSEKSKKTINYLLPTAEKHYKETNQKAGEIRLYHIDVETENKQKVLEKLLSILPMSQTIVFVESKATAKKLYEGLKMEKYTVALIHGDMDPSERDSSFQDYKNAKVKILISTDVFSRGMDIPQVNLIINYAMPKFDMSQVLMTYTHRIGRSGRFDRTGFVIDFISSEEDLNLVNNAQKEYGCVSRKITAEDLEKAFEEETLYNDI